MHIRYILIFLLLEREREKKRRKPAPIDHQPRFFFVSCLSHSERRKGRDALIRSKILQTTTTTTSTASSQVQAPLEKGPQPRRRSKREKKKKKKEKETDRRNIREGAKIRRMEFYDVGTSALGELWDSYLVESVSCEMCIAPV